MLGGETVRDYFTYRSQDLVRTAVVKRSDFKTKKNKVTKCIGIQNDSDK